MKYSYFCAKKAGKYLLREIFLKNNRSSSLLVTGKPPAYATCITPDWKRDWYWENNNGELVHHEYQDTPPDSNEQFDVHNGYHSETWFYIPTYDSYSIKKYLKDRPEVKASDDCPGHFHKCYNHCLSMDLCVNPLPMLGYLGEIGTGKMADRLFARQPNMKNLSFVGRFVERLRARKNYIGYKEDIRHHAYNFFAGTGRPVYMNPDVLFTNTEEKYVAQITKRINNNRRFIVALQYILDYYDIPYEFFNLDNDSYSEKFGVTETFDRYASDLPFVDKPTYQDKIEQWVDDYVKKYP